LIIDRLIADIISTETCSEIFIDCIRTELVKWIEESTQEESYNIWNLKENGWENVGKYDENELELAKEVVFIGNTYITPNNDLYEIKITGNKDPNEPNGLVDGYAPIMGLTYDILIDQYNESEEVL